MSSALKPVLTTTGPQNTPGPTQLNKPMHPQSANSPYSQTTTHVPQNLVNLPLSNPNTAHNNPTHTNTHLANNHFFFNQNYQQNLGHPPNVLPPTTTQQQQQQIAQETSEKLQSNGTTEAKSPPTTKAATESPQNHVTVSSDKSPPSTAPSQSPSVQEKVKIIVTPEKQQPIPASTTVTTTEQKSDVKVTTEVIVTPPVALVVPTSVVTCIASTVTSSTPSPTTSSSVTTAATTVTSAADSTETTSTTAAAPSSTSTTVTSLPQESTVQAAKTSSSDIATTSQANNQKNRDQSPQQKNSPAKATVVPRTPTRKSKAPSASRQEIESSKPSTSATKSDPKISNVQKSPGSAGKSKRSRTRTQPYQSPLPELKIITKMTTPSKSRSRGGDDKLIIFYKNEFLAVRNCEGTFYICQAVQNIYKRSARIRIRWLSQDENEKSGEIYTPDYYDTTDFDCILTNLNLKRVDKDKFRLPLAEKVRTDSILKRALAVEKGDATPPSLTEEHPDGLDLSLYKEESQLQQRKGKVRKAPPPAVSKTKATVEKKSPDQVKVRKLTPRRGSKARSSARKLAVASTSVATTSSAIVKKSPAILESKKQPTTPASVSRIERAMKRRSADSSGSTKTSPVVDQKKAKVLAKVVRKAAVSASKNTAKNVTKTSKQTSSSSAAATTSAKNFKAAAVKQQLQVFTYKTKRTTRK